MSAATPLRLRPVTGSEDVDQLASELAAGFGGDPAPAREMLIQTHGMLSRDPRPEPWGAYIALQDQTAVGTCAFKSAPDPEGGVEIAYMTFPEFEGRGHATAMVGALVLTAFNAGANAVIAHTLAEENSSSKALKRNGFSFDEELVDPEDGPVWRWIKRL